MSNNKGPITLDVDLTEVDTSIPVLPKGLYDLQIASFEQMENKEKTGYNLKVGFKTTSVIESTNGTEVKPGFQLFAYFPLQSKEGSTFDWKVKLAQLQEAALNEKRPRFDSEELIGKIVRVSCAPEESEEYGLTTKLGRMTYPDA